MRTLIVQVWTWLRKHKSTLAAIGTFATGIVAALEYFEKTHVLTSIHKILVAILIGSTLGAPPSEQTTVYPTPVDATKRDSERINPSFSEISLAVVFESIAAADAQFYQELLGTFPKFSGKWPSVPPSFYAYAVDFYTVRQPIGRGFRPTVEFLRTVWVRCEEPYPSRLAKEYCLNRDKNWREHNHIPRYLNMNFLEYLPR